MSDDRRPLVQEQRHLLPLRRHLHGRQRRRHRRLQGAVAPARLPARPWHHHDLADALSALARQGRRLRYRRLLRRRSPLRHAWRLRRVHPWLQAARHPRHHRSRGQSHLERTCLVQVGAERKGFTLSRLVRLGRPEARRSRQGHGVSRRAEIDLVARQASRRLVLPPLLRFPARPQHLEPDGAGGNPQDHGLLDSARRLRLPHGRGALCDLDQGREGEEAGRTIRHAARVSRIPAVARKATPSSLPKPTCCPTPTCNISAATATACT